VSARARATSSFSPIAAPASRTPRAGGTGRRWPATTVARGAAGSHHGVDGAAAEIEDRENRRRPAEGSPSHPAEEDRCGMGSPAVRPSGRPSRARTRAAAEVVFHQRPPAAGELPTQVGREIGRTRHNWCRRRSPSRPRRAFARRRGPASASSCLISCSARSSRSSDIADSFNRDIPGRGPVRGVSMCPRVTFARPRCGHMESTSATHAL